MKLVMGLGNPGEQYQSHRHNVGYMMLDKLARRLNVELDIKKKKTVFGKKKQGKIEYLLLKPLTFMNLSGEAALYMASFMKILPEDIIVIYDDMDLPIGTFKISVGGSHGGHNGVRSIEDSLKSTNFTRIRVGIGRPPDNMDVSDFVLSPFTKQERQKIKLITDDIIEASRVALFETPTIAMNKFNRKIKPLGDDVDLPEDSDDEL